MNRAIPLLLSCFVLSSCAAHMLETHGDKIQLFKTGQEKPGKGGSIRWLANGPKFLKEGRRRNAEKQMRDFCGGDYAITAEGPRSKFGSAMPIPGGKATIELDEYWYAAFECAAKP